MEGQVPRREPRVLPLVGHRHDVEGVEVAPAGVAARRAVTPAAAAGSGRRRASGRRRSSRAACSTASRRTPGASPCASSARRAGGRQLGVELVGLAAGAARRPASKSGPSGGRLGPVPRGPQPQPQLDGRARRDRRPGTRRAPSCPARSGLTVAAPATTWSLMPSFGYGGAGAAPKRRSTFVSFSQNSSVGRVAVRARRRRAARASPRNGWSIATAPSPAAAQRRLRGVDVPGPGVAEPGGRQHVQRVGVGPGVRDPDRHQQVGRDRPWRSRPRRSSSGRRRRRPVSSSSYSGSCLPRRPFSATRSSYGNAPCG